MTSNPFQFTAMASKAEILLYGPIGDDFDGVSAKTFAENLMALGELTDIGLRINSPGGSAFQGIAIYNTLNNHPAKVRVDIDGVAASAASVIAMSGDTIHMAENALMMLHNASGMSMGTAADMDQMAKILRSIDGQLVTTYAARTGKTKEEVAAWMEASTWFTAEDAKANGLVTEITAAKKIAACFDSSKMPWLKNMPESLLSIANQDLQAPQKSHTRLVAAARLEPQRSMISWMK